MVWKFNEIIYARKLGMILVTSSILNDDLISIEITLFSL